MPLYPSNTYFKGVENYGDSLCNELLESNLLSFLDWGFLNIGAYTNVSSGDFTSYSSTVDESQLFPVEQPGYDLGEVWRSIHQRWVYESGIDYTPAPTSPVVIYNNGSIVSSSNYYINFPEGKVIFNSVQSVENEIFADYSYKNVYITSFDSSYIQDLQRNIWDLTDPSLGSGDYDQPTELVSQLPAIGIEIVDNRNFQGYQLGGGQWIFQDVLFHIYTETDYECNNILDIISYQNDKGFYLYDPNTLAASGDFNLDYRGSPISGAPNYPDIVKLPEDGGHMWGRCWFTETKIQDKQRITSKFYAGIIRTTLMFIKLDI